MTTVREFLNIFALDNIQIIMVNGKEYSLAQTINYHKNDTVVLATVSAQNKMLSSKDIQYIIDEQVLENFTAEALLALDIQIPNGISYIAMTLELTTKEGGETHE